MENPNNEIDEQIEGSGKKGSTWPVKSLNPTIDFVANVYKVYGSTDYQSGEVFAAENGLKLNTIKSLLSTAQQYGLIKKQHGTGYKITDLFRKIFHPEDEAERLQGVIESLRAPALYAELFKRYEGQLVPNNAGLINMLVRNFEMEEHIAKKAVEVFLQNLRDYKLTTDRGILYVAVRPIKIEATINDAQEESKNKEMVVSKSQGRFVIDDDPDDDMIKIPIRLKGKRMAYLSFPSEYDDQDLKRIETVIKAYVNIYNDNDDKDSDLV